jgi:predicted ATP-dependent endonuclease of OLD family
VLEQDPAFRSFVSHFLKSTSTGVDHLETPRKQISEDQLSRMLLIGPRTVDRKADLEIVNLSGGKELIIDRNGGGYYQIGIQAAHACAPGETVRLDLIEESDGTLRLLDLIPALHPTAFTGTVHVIDEIDRSLHPILVRKFMEFFLKSSVGEQRQVIVTTHESNLLDQDLLRRDEIWFAEKDPTGATKLYSLLDFKVRNDLEIRKHYLQGRFGAIPFLGNLENLLPKADPHE